MANQFCLTHLATLMLLLITWKECLHCTGFSVDPPQDLMIIDPGHLGYLEITWSLPASLKDRTECPKLYQLEYFNTHKNSWTAVRTVKRTHRAQFDLMKDIRVRVYTLLNGPCTNGTLIKSTNYTELVHKPPSTGFAGTVVQDFVCVYYNMEHMECTWGRSTKMSTDSQPSLYYWHKPLEKAEECPKYIILNGIRSGCDFTGISLPDFTDINFCLNGSSPEGPLKPAFVTLQIQNHVKPYITEKLDLRTGPDTQLELHWDSPVGRIPEHCLEWEVEHNQDGPDGKTALKQISTKQTSLTLPSIVDKEEHCFRVRSKVNKYCAEKSLWSDWSHRICHPATDVTIYRSFEGEDEDKKDIQSEPQWDMVPVYVYIAFAIIAILVLLLCIGAVLKGKRSRQVMKTDTVYTTLFGKTPVSALA